MACTQLEVVAEMRLRKAGLARRGDAFVALPGGFGTPEEISEILVERPLGFLAKPLVLVNPDGYWDPLLAPEHAAVCSVAKNVAEAMAWIGAPPPTRATPPDEKW